MASNHILGKHYKYSYFWNGDDWICACLLTNGTTDEECLAIQKELNLSGLDWNYVGGRTVLKIKHKDLDRFYDIINAFVARNNRVHAQDGTCVTFSTKASRETHEKLFLKAMESAAKYGWPTPPALPVHLEDCWESKEGKAFARSALVDLVKKGHVEKDSRCIGEFLVKAEAQVKSSTKPTTLSDSCIRVSC